MGYGRALSLAGVLAFSACGGGGGDDALDTTSGAASTTVASTTVASTTVASTTVASTTVASTTVASTTVDPGGMYDVVVTVDAFYNPIPSNREPSDVMLSLLEFEGLCDGVGPCALLLDYDNFTLDTAVIDVVKVGGVELTPLGAGSYSTTVVGPYSDFCPMPTTIEFAVTLTAAGVAGTFSQIPETREIYSYDNGSQCWGSTFDLTISGERPPD